MDEISKLIAEICKGEGFNWLCMSNGWNIRVADYRRLVGELLYALETHGPYDEVINEVLDNIPDDWISEEVLQMKKISFGEMAQIMRNHEATHPKEHITGYVVFREDNWPDEHYSLESRTYAVSSVCKAFQPNMCGSSIFGDAIDGSDPGVQLDVYMYMHGGIDYWKVDYCYMDE